MPIKTIRLFGDPVLTTPSTLVTAFDKELHRLVKDLMATMDSSNAVGLAAPQIGVPLRVFVWNINGQSGHLVNPSLDLSEEIQDGIEGCMSLPDLRYDTKRSMHIIAKGFNMSGDPISITGSQMLARALQHETDHLDGILFIDRLSPEDRKLAMKEIRQSDWFNDSTLATPKIKFSPHA